MTNNNSSARRPKSERGHNRTFKASNMVKRVMRWHDLGSSARSKSRRLVGPKQVACAKAGEPKSRPALRVAAKIAAGIVAGHGDRLHYSLRPAPRQRRFVASNAHVFHHVRGSQSPASSVAAVASGTNT